MLKRKISQKLTKWNNSNSGKALIVEGARQVGKTYSIRQFAKENFNSFIEINFIENPSLINIFSGDLNADSILLNISLYIPNSVITEGSTLIFLDEIQECERAITSLKFLSSDNRFKVICSGSALGMAFKNKTSYPVGQIEYLELCSLDFEEFLWAMSVERRITDILQFSLQTCTKVPEPIQEKMRQYFRQYIVIGGMPEAVQTFVDTNNYKKTDDVQRRLYRNYLNDIARYAEPEIKLKAEKCYKSIPSQLSKENHKFQYSVVEHRGTKVKFSSSIDWLEHAHLIQTVCNVKCITYPLETVRDDNSFRIYPNDICFLIAAYGYELKAAILNDNSLESNGDNIILGTVKGGMYEALASEILYKSGIKKQYFYRNDAGTIEIEFLTEGVDGIYPIEIKAGRSKTKSLNAILENFSVSKGFKFCDQNIGKKDKKITLPLYLLPFAFSKDE